MIFHTDDLDEEDRPTIYCEDLESVLNRLNVASGRMVG